MSVRILIGDCMERMHEMADNSVDACVTDPPYHLSSIVKRFGSPDSAPCKVGKTGAYARASKGFMGQTWDGGDVAFRVETWAEVLRVLKPGGHLVAFSGTRTYHRMVVAIEDADFEVRDMIAWHYGSGFPKSHDISKAIDRAAGAEREVTPSTLMAVGSEVGSISRNRRCEVCDKPHAAADPCACPRDSGPATDEARKWQGYGTALKPATEPICLARKPLSEKSIAANVLKWGTGALNIDGCRVAGEVPTTFRGANALGQGSGWNKTNLREPQIVEPHPQGRWPANLAHDGSDEVLAGFPDAHGAGAAREGSTNPVKTEGYQANAYGVFTKDTGAMHRFGDSGSAARFFYSAKVSAEERAGSNHPTMKPVALMRWLCRMVTPKGGTVLDPFCGSGSTLIAADAEQFNAIGCELSPEYAAIAERRIRDSAGMFADVKVAA